MYPNNKVVITALFIEGNGEKIDSLAMLSPLKNPMPCQLDSVESVKLFDDGDLKFVASSTRNTATPANELYYQNHFIYINFFLVL